MSTLDDFFGGERGVGSGVQGRGKENNILITRGNQESNEFIVRSVLHLVSLMRISL